MIIRFCTILLFCLAASPSYAFSGIKNELSEAQTLLSKDDFNGAIAIYEGLLARGYYSADLHYNLGCSHYEQKATGRALLNFERALKYSPNHKKAYNNIETIKSEQSNPIYEVQVFFLKKIWQNVCNCISPGAWAILSLAFLGGAAYLFFLLMFNKNSYSHKSLLWLIAIILLLFLISLFAGKSRLSSFQNNPYAIVMSEVNRYSGPSEKSILDEDKIPEGTKVLVLEQLSGWYKVSLPDLDQVWLTEDMFEKI